MEIEYLEGQVLYENPKPHLRSRHGFFPGLARLASGDLLCLFVIAEAFESSDGTTYAARSKDLGRTWQIENPVYDRSTVGFPTNDTLKPAQLRDGGLVALGYRFHRHDPEQGIGLPETGGILPGDNIISFSSDQGRTWTTPRVLAFRYPELLETAGGCIELSRGDLVATAACFALPDGSNPSGHLGVLLRSTDQGQTWDDKTHFFDGAATGITPFESRLCQMEDGRLVVIFWAYDAAHGKHLPNHTVVSHDNGQTWSKPIDTKHMGQAASLLPLQGDMLMSIHAHRGESPGIYVRAVDFRGDYWRPVAEAVIYGDGTATQTRAGQSAAQMFQSLRFGQPTLLHLGGGEVLAAHWCIEDGQGKIRIHRLRVRL